MISDEDKDRVRSATDLVQLVQETVELKPRAQEFWGCCPFHGEKTPSFHVIPSTQVWHCFGCGEGGDVFTYVMKRENLSFPDAIRYLADRAGIELVEQTGVNVRKSSPRMRLIEACEAACELYHTLLMRGRNDQGRTYCKQRALDAAACKRYRLGFAPGHGVLVSHLRSLGFSTAELLDANLALRRSSGLADRFYDRVMFPIFDEQGRCIAFGGRVLGAGEPKYLNTAETPLFHKKRNLYGFNWAKEHIVASNEAIVVEGYTDAIACWEAGLTNVVATLGTALTEHHVKTLTRFARRIVYLFDGDAAGQKAAERAVQFVETGSVDLRCVTLPDNMDPNDFVLSQGGDALRGLIDEAEPLLDFVFRKVEERSDVRTPAGRSDALREACRVIYPLRESYMIDRYYMQIADRLAVDVEMVRECADSIFLELQKAERLARARQEAASSATPAVEPQYQSAPHTLDRGAYASATAEARPAGGVEVAYTELERRALAGERELVCLLTAHPEAFRPFSERIADMNWVDPRYEAIAWAALATPEGSDAACVMDAARAVCPEAPQLVGAGTIGATSAHPTETNIEFLLNALELNTLRRRMNTAQGQLRSDTTLDDQKRKELIVSVASDSARARELAHLVEDVANPFRSSLDT